MSKFKLKTLSDEFNKLIANNKKDLSICFNDVYLLNIHKCLKTVSSHSRVQLTPGIPYPIALFQPGTSLLSTISPQNFTSLSNLLSLFYFFSF